MAHADTERKIKKPIAALLVHPPFCNKLVLDPRINPRERTLLGTRFKSDFAYATCDGGWFFIEDDDAARALSNLIKYWDWIESRNIATPVSLVHLIGPTGPGPRRLVEFLQKRAHDAVQNFRTRFVWTKDWETKTWISQFREAALSLPPFC